MGLEGFINETLLPFVCVDGAVVVESADPVHPPRGRTPKECAAREAT